MQDTPTASVAIPTRERPQYLEVALRSIMPQASQAGAEVLVVTDGPDAASEQAASRHGVKTIALPEPQGLNAARNAALRAARGELIVFVDDDVEAPQGWLRAYLDGALACPDCDAFGGPIEARLEGGGPHACGREKPPITTLDLGEEDRDVTRVWGANMAIRARALERVGYFDEAINGTGDEEDWLRRHIAAGGRVRYLGAARVIHRRRREDARLAALTRAAYSRGRAARRYDERTGHAPPLRRELLTVAGCGWHTVRRRCALGIVSAALSAGRLREALNRS